MATDDAKVKSITVEWADGSVSSFAPDDGFYRRRVTGPSGGRKERPGTLPDGDYFVHEIRWTEQASEPAVTS